MLILSPEERAITIQVHSSYPWMQISTRKRRRSYSKLCRQIKGPGPRGKGWESYEQQLQSPDNVKVHKYHPQNLKEAVRRDLVTIVDPHADGANHQPAARYDLMQCCFPRCCTHLSQSWVHSFSLLVHSKLSGKCKPKQQVYDSREFRSVCSRDKTGCPA